MTTSIRTLCGGVYLADTIGNYFYEVFKDRPDCDECLDAVRDFVVDHVNEHLTDQMTWYPYLSEVYVQIWPDSDEIDDREIDEVLTDLISDAMAEAEKMLDKDPNAFSPADGTHGGEE